LIISASRRTDIPAFFDEWFMRRITEGFFDNVNPFNRSEDVAWIQKMWTVSSFGPKIPDPS
jgi:hypothetical protein